MNYITLCSAIVAWSHNDSDELKNQLPTIIEHACRTVGQEIDAIGLDVITTVEASAGTPYVTIPQDIYVVKHVVKTSGTQKEFLRHRPYDYLLEAWPDATSVGGNPTHYTRLNDTQLYVAPTPTSTQLLELRNVTVSIPTSSNPESYLLNRFPHLIFAASMLETSLFMKDMEDLQFWQGRYDRVRDDVENEARRNRRDDGSTRNPLNNTQTANNLKDGVK